MKKLILIITLSFVILLPNTTYAAGFLDSLTCVTDEAINCGLDDAVLALQNLINDLFKAIGAFALVYFVYGGIWWLTSSGNADKIKRGKDIMIGTVTAIFIVFTSYLFINFYLNDILNVNYPEDDEPQAIGCVSEIEGGTSCGGDTDCLGFAIIPAQWQCKDMSPSLNSMLSCIDGELTASPAIEKSDVIITSISDNNGLGACRDNWNDDCIHEEDSCHYGGSAPQTNGSYAMDFRWIDLDTTQKNALANIVLSCSGDYEVRTDGSSQEFLHVVIGVCDDLSS